MPASFYKFRENTTNSSGRDILKASGMGATAPAVPRELLARGASTQKPDSVSNLADDLGYGDLACYGSKTNRTPNIDALAEGGVKFTDFHSNRPACSPTREALPPTLLYQQRSWS